MPSVKQPLTYSVVRDQVISVPAVDARKLPDEAGKALAELSSSSQYRAILWAGGYPGHVPHSHSDIDFYAVLRDPHREHWFMERIGGRRVELTAYTLPEWQAILARPYRHPKHHFTFAHGAVVHDPENLCPPLAATATRTLAEWTAPTAELEELRVSVAIQRDKIAGYHEKAMPLHLRLYAVGFAQLACLLLVTHWDGFGVDGGKNLTRVLEHPRCPPSVHGALTTLLSSTELAALAAAACALADECLALTGGAVDVHHGGLPR